MKFTAKLTLIILSIAISALFISSIFYSLRVEDSLRNHALTQLESTASSQAHRIESILGQSLERLILVGSRTQLRISLRDFAATGLVEDQERMNRILEDARSSISDFNSISVSNLAGQVVASTDATNIGKAYADEDFFLKGLEGNRVDLLYLDENSHLNVRMVGPLFLDEVLIGVLIIEATADTIVSVTADYTGLGNTGETFLIRENEDGNALFLTPLRFNAAAALKETVSRDELNRVVIQALSDKPQTSIEIADYRGEPVFMATRAIPETDWKLVAKIDHQEALAPIIQLRNQLLQISLVVTAIVVAVAVYTARTITNPIVNLTEAAQKISQGDLTPRVDETSTDEIGVLTRTFNQMAGQLSGLITTLESRVTTRTRDLKVASDVSRQITTILELDELLPRLVEITREAFELYYTSVFLYRPAEQKLVLVAGTGEAGRQMIMEGLSYALEARPSLVAKAAREKSNVIINDVGQEKSHAYNPHLPDTQSEMVLPMMVGDKLVGVLGLQSEMKDRFTTDDIEIFSILAEQIAVAVNNAQLYALQINLAQELHRADQIKSQFLASMSHELRTPLNAIINFTEMIAMGMMGAVNDEQKDLLEQSLASAQHLLNLINDVLDISKIQAGKLNLYIEDDVRLGEEIATVVSMVRPLLKHKPVQLIQDIDDHLPLLSGDKRRIRQIMLNLLSNAAKFTHEGSITLSAKNRDDHVQLAVIDCGPGISSEMQSIIFEPFMQTVEGVKHAEGTGLGLPITKSLIEAHNGRIWVESEPGEGAAFYVILPIQTNNHTEA